MSITKEEARQEIADLVAKYQSLTAIAIKKYTEADTRRTFIEPLFQALGWDVYSREEVTEEVKVATGRVDYVFKLHGVSQFYLEAKALRAELTKPEYIKQAITYAYNKGITWAVLTDFEGLQIYNAQAGRLFINLSCDNYIRDFEDLWLLSRESLESNALNEKAEKYGALPPRMGVEQKLFNQLRQWREELFTQLYHYNPSLSYNRIDEVIQRLFNRLIFIRTCEDRRIEDRVLRGAVHEWRSSGRKGELIESLRGIFRNFDGYYDSDLFASHITDQVFIESITIEGIINGLYEILGGMASYDFSLIDADVLGAVYEQYLGHVATVVKQRAKKAQIRMDLGYPVEPTFEITAKKERRKEHGIYYTPRFVTNYIVKETVGRFIKEHSHNEIINVKILDPACGSGSFLIRAYDELLSYHAYRSGKSVIELDQWERLPILIKNIFGVDLDMQAVEIARLNLLLRSLAKRETLPSLADNIRQGNSLISGTEEELRSYFGDNWREKKPFNWEQEFKDIMANRGFDIVIGNPPYVTYQMSSEEKEFYKNLYASSISGKINTYRLFVHRALMVIKENGLFAFIIPNTWMSDKNASNFRKMLLANFRIIAVHIFGEKVFREVTQATTILVMQKDASAGEKDYDIRIKLAETPEDLEGEEVLVKLSDVLFDKNGDRVFVATFAPSSYRLKRKTEGRSARLAEIIEGVHTGEVQMDLYAESIFDKGGKGKFPLIRGRNISRYHIDLADRRLGAKWFTPPEGFVRGKNAMKKRILVLRRSNIAQAQRIKAGLLDSVSEQSPIFAENGVNFILTKENNYSEKYILGLLNSKLLNWLFKLSSSNTQINALDLLQLPIRRIDFDNPSEKKMHDDLVALVDKMLELNKRLAPIRNTPCNERDELRREINRTDNEIDNLVYGLYELTEEERKIVEGRLK